MYKDQYFFFLETGTEVGILILFLDTVLKNLFGLADQLKLKLRCVERNREEIRSAFFRSVFHNFF